MLSTDPTMFRLEFGQSEKSQNRFTMDGHGRIYEDDQLVAEDLADWLEAVSRGGGRLQAGG